MVFTDNFISFHSQLYGGVPRRRILWGDVACSPTHQFVIKAAETTCGPATSQDVPII
jgi:hypothetical protein